MVLLVLTTVASYHETLSRLAADRRNDEDGGELDGPGRRYTLWSVSSGRTG